MKTMLQYLLDTDMCIYLLNGNQQVKEHVTQAGVASLAVTIITIGELYFGAYNSSRTADNKQRIREFLAPPGPEILSLTQSAAEYFGESKAELRRRGQPVGDMDLLIAGIAREHDLTIVTNNVQHFQRISDLKVENWL